MFIEILIICSIASAGFVSVNRDKNKKKKETPSSAPVEFQVAYKEKELRNSEKNNHPKPLK